MANKIYRIEIPSKTLPGKVFVFFIGKDGELVDSISDAVPCTDEEHLAVMERIACPATAYDASLKGGHLAKGAQVGR